MSYMHTHWRDVDVGNIFAKDSLKYSYGIKKLLFCILASELSGIIRTLTQQNFDKIVLPLRLSDS